MSQYAHLSKPDPEFAALLEQWQTGLPLASLQEPPTDIAAAQREWIEHGQQPYAGQEKARLRPGQ